MIYFLYRLICGTRLNDEICGAFASTAGSWMGKTCLTLLSGQKNGLNVDRDGDRVSIVARAMAYSLYAETRGSLYKGL